MPMLFPIAPGEFWKQIKIIVEEVIAEKSRKQKIDQRMFQLPEKALMKPSDVCKLFQISKPTLYEWLRQKKLKSFKISSRRYFNRADIDEIIRSGF